VLINLVPDFLSVLGAPDRDAAWHRYFESHSAVLNAYWKNYVLEPESPAAENVIRKGTKVKDRFFVSQTFNELILDGLRLGMYKIPREAYHSFYSPGRIAEFQESPMDETFGQPRRPQS